MPVILDRGPAGYGLFGPQPIAAPSSSRAIEVALINNMPDSARKATEEQFATLLTRAAGDMFVRVRLFSLAGGEPGDACSRQAYPPIGRLWDSKVDALIVTGTEPRAAALPDEPYWSTLTRLVDWAERSTISTIWSCLAAHAAVLHRDGIRRRALPQKRSGLFEFDNTSDHALMTGMPARFIVPHSRQNDLHESDLTSCGYGVLSRSADAGVDTFVKDSRSTFVFFQGHPEYTAETLFREYRRDVARFLKHEKDAYPAMPVGYFSAEMRNRLMAFRRRALARPNPDALADFPILADQPAKSWSRPAARFYRNWLVSISQQKAARTGGIAESFQRSRRPPGITASRPPRASGAARSQDAGT